jgi:hypothetical protein
MAALTDIRNGLLRYSTTAFIDEHSVLISLNRKIKVTKPGGGHDKVDITIPPQKFRLINQSASDGLTYSANDDGAARKLGYIMVGAYDADVQIDDTWSEGEEQFHVDGLIANNEYETRAVVTGFAKVPLHG